jgi:L-cysteate sulfo-lyase
MRLPIFQASKQRANVLKRLREQPRLAFGHFPTPIREMTRLRGHLGCVPRLWIKNEDCTGPAFGGNKVRKLEYVLGRALAEKVDEVITAGGITSNHVRVTAGLCARLGITCRLVVNVPKGQPVPALGRPASLLLDEMFGATIHRVERRDDRMPEMKQLAAEAAAKGLRALIIPVGASAPLGSLGFLHAAAELRKQVKANKIHVRAIFHATSSGGTQAGLIAGVRLFGPETTRVIGVSVDDSATQIAETVRAILTGMNELVGLSGDFAMDGVEVEDRFTGPGYAVPSEEGKEAIATLARIEGEILDPIYTAKAMAGFLHHVRGGEFGKGDDLLFWHTGGQLALFQEVVTG